jgi:arylamine N-acetyltransferase
MRHQLFSVPFENLDVQAGKIVSLAPDDIADKVLKKGRGGYCYEVNGLFAMALAALGILTVSWRRARCSTPRGGRKPIWRSSPRWRADSGFAISGSAATASARQWRWTRLTWISRRISTRFA